MKKLVLFIAVVILLPMAFAESQIFSGKVLTDTDKVIEGGIFKFTYDATSNKAFVQTPSTGLIIDNGECKSNDLFKVCINKANFSYRNETTWVSYYDIDTTIYKLTGSLSTASKSTLAEMLQNQQAEFSITITNPTDFEITSINYKEDLSPFTIIQVTGCSLDGSILSWQGTLKSKWDKTCTAKISASKEGTYTLKGDLTYFNGYETEKKTTDSVSIKVLPKQLKLIKIMDNVTEIKRPFFINMSVQNTNKDERLEASITIELPGNIALLKDISGFSKDYNVLKYNSILSPNTFFNYSLYLEANYEEQKPIKQKFDYTIKDVTDSMENETFVNAIEPVPVIDFSAQPAEAIAGQSFVVLAKIKNPSKFHEITEIKAKLDSPYNDKIIQKLDKLKPGDSYAIISNTLIIPNDAADTIRIELCIEYKFFVAVKSISKSLEVKIKKAEQQAATSPNDTKLSQETKTEQIASLVQEPNKTLEKESEQQPLEAKPSEVISAELFNKKNLPIIGGIFIALLIIPIIVFLIRKRKKGSAQEQSSEELKPPPPMK